MEKYFTQNNKMTFFSANWSFLSVGFVLLVGMVLSIMSWLEICVEHCSASQDYRFMGVPFSYAGLGFFTTALIIHFFSRTYLRLKQFLGYLIALALGSEIVFLAIQKNEIKQWCPICVSIAISVGIAGLILSLDYFKELSKQENLNRRGQLMDIIKKGFTSLSFAFLGVLMAFIGVSKFDQAEAAMNDMQSKLAFGNRSSPIDVYFVTDWFCPSCKKVEPIIEKVFPLIETRVNFYFIDYAIHKKSMNFTPYNLAFLVHDKPRYLDARRHLQKLAEENDNPNDDDVLEISQRNQLKFQELNFLEVKAGMEFFDKIVEKYNLRSTPVLIIANSKTHQVVKLEGRDEIKEDKILQAIKSMENK